MNDQEGAAQPARDAGAQQSARQGERTGGREQRDREQRDRDRGRRRHSQQQNQPRRAAEQQLPMDELRAREAESSATVIAEGGGTEGSRINRAARRSSSSFLWTSCAISSRYLQSTD